jgi:HD-like signal output (HDOD) protein
MSTTVEQRERVVAAAIREISHIATLPEITVKIIELVENPSSSAQELHEVISQDPALCSRILKVVNSSFYGLPAQIGSINRAIVLLGLNAVKNIAIAASLAKLYRGGELCPSFAARDVWQHSGAVAVATKMLTDTLKIGMPDEAFLAGLMHDIGVMVELQFDRAKLIEVIEQLGVDREGVPGNNMLEVEDQVFGANHQDFGAGLCARWKFPAPFGMVARFHHAPMNTPSDSRVLPCIVYLADRLVARLPKAYRHDLVDLKIDQAVLDTLRISNEQLAKIEERLEVEIFNAALILR